MLKIVELVGDVIKVVYDCDCLVEIEIKKDDSLVIEVDYVVYYIIVD